jgi:DNA-binding FrmR family transcriptional regulator
MKSTAAVHETHPSILKRLRRAEGHLHRVITMFAESRSCLDLAQQLYAVERAVAQAKKELIRDHVDHCLEIAASRDGEDVSGVVSEFKAICRYL